jgi:broad specificity phosphatase PhoE
MLVVLVTHADARAYDPERGDLPRGLTGLGWRHATWAGEQLNAGLGTALKPTVLLSSPALRCVQTGSEVAAVLGLRLNPSTMHGTVKGEDRNKGTVEPIHTEDRLDPDRNGGRPIQIDALRDVLRPWEDKGTEALLLSGHADLANALNAVRPLREECLTADKAWFVLGPAFAVFDFGRIVDVRAVAIIDWSARPALV